MHTLRVLLGSLLIVAGIVLPIAGWSIRVAMHLPPNHYATEMVIWGLICCLWARPVLPK